MIRRILNFCIVTSSGFNKDIVAKSDYIIYFDVFFVKIWEYMVYFILFFIFALDRELSEL
jgi:hypothetical protein